MKSRVDKSGITLALGLSLILEDVRDVFRFWTSIRSERRGGEVETQEKTTHTGLILTSLCADSLRERDPFALGEGVTGSCTDCGLGCICVSGCEYGGSGGEVSESVTFGIMSLVLQAVTHSEAQERYSQFHELQLHERNWMERRPLVRICPLSTTRPPF